MASAYLQEPWAGASAGIWSEAKYSRSDDSDKRRNPFDHSSEKKPNA